MKLAFFFKQFLHAMGLHFSAGDRKIAGRWPHKLVNDHHDFDNLSRHSTFYAAYLCTCQHATESIFIMYVRKSTFDFFYDIIKEGKISKDKSTKQKQHSIPFHDRDWITNFWKKRDFFFFIRNVNVDILIRIRKIIPLEKRKSL